MNKCFEDIGETPFSRRKAQRKDYSRQKIEKLTKALQDTEIRDDGSRGDGSGGATGPPSSLDWGGGGAQGGTEHINYIF